MTSTALKGLLKAEPFQPFSVVLSSGDRYPVKHPERLWILKDRVLIATGATADELPDDYVTVAYLHIAAAEPLKNASRRRRRA